MANRRKGRQNTRKQVIDGSLQEAGVSSMKRTQDARIDDAGGVHSDEKPKKGSASKGGAAGGIGVVKLSETCVRT